MIPPSPGAEDRTAGTVTPIVPFSSSSRYSPQPTATAATDTPCSNTRHQPQTQATSSPIVAYAYDGRGAGDRDGARRLGVRQGREQRRGTGDHERRGDRGAGLRDGVTEDDEDAGAEGGTDADHGELPQTEGASERPSLTLAALRDQVFHGLATHEARPDAGGCGGGGLAWVLRGGAWVEHAPAPCRCRSGRREPTAPLRAGTHRAGSPHATYETYETYEATAYEERRCPCNAATLRIAARSLRSSVLHGCSLHDGFRPLRGAVQRGSSTRRSSLTRNTQGSTHSRIMPSTSSYE